MKKFDLPFCNLRLTILSLIFLLGYSGRKVFSAHNIAQTDRVSRVHFDRSKVFPIYVKQGLSTVIQFPCPILEAKLGPSSLFEVLLSPNLKRELSVFSRHNSSLPTNLIVSCERSTFIFDLIPSHKKHQDLIRIESAHGQPGVKSYHLIESSFSTSSKSSSKKEVVSILSPKKQKTSSHPLKKMAEDSAQKPKSPTKKISKTITVHPPQLLRKGRFPHE